MYGFNFLISANHLAGAAPISFTAAAASYQQRLLRSTRRSPAAATAAGIDSFAISDIHNSYERKIPPPELSRSVVKLQCDSSADGGVCDVYLVGAYSYAESWRQVEGVIQLLKPQVVLLEMCSSREHRLTGQKVELPTIREMVDMLKNKQNPFWRLVKWYLCRNQQVDANDDFRVAYAEAMKYGGKVIFGDRPREITFSRYWAKISLREIFSHLKGFTISVHKGFDKKDDIEEAKIVVQAMNEVSPTFTETFIHECDRYMSAKFLEVAREHNKVVAVVEWVHLPVIEKHWKEPIDMKQLHSVPMAKTAIMMGIIKLLIFMILRWFKKRIDCFMQMK